MGLSPAPGGWRRWVCKRWDCPELQMGWRAGISWCQRCRRGEDEEQGDEKGPLQGKVRTEGFPSSLTMTRPLLGQRLRSQWTRLQGNLKFCSD